MIKNLPIDFVFAPLVLPLVLADEYIRQINVSTKYYAEYCGTSKIIETYIILDSTEGLSKQSWFTEIT